MEKIIANGNILALSVYKNKINTNVDNFRPMFNYRAMHILNESRGKNDNNMLENPIIKVVFSLGGKEIVSIIDHGDPYVKHFTCYNRKCIERFHTSGEAIDIINEDTCKCTPICRISTEAYTRFCIKNSELPSLENLSRNIILHNVEYPRVLSLINLSTAKLSQLS